MPAATAETVIIFVAWLPITLIGEACDMAASFTSIYWQIIRVVRVVKTRLLKWINMFCIIDFVIDVHAIVDLWSKGARAEAALYYCVTGLGPVAHCCTAASTCTVFVTFAWHTFAFIFVAVCWTRRLLGGLFWGFCCRGLNYWWFNFRICRFLSWLVFGFYRNFWIHLWSDSMTSRLLSFFAIFMACFICFTVDWLGLLLFHLPCLLFLFSLFRCLLLCSNSVVLLSHLRWDFEAFILMMWDNWFQMRMIRSKIPLDIVFVCASIAMIVMMNILVWREMLMLFSRCDFIVLFV